MARGLVLDLQGLKCEAIGTVELLARATDETGDTQGVRNVRNALGYANNAAQPVRVDAR